jgi:hypothetical protein
MPYIRMPSNARDSVVRLPDLQAKRHRRDMPAVPQMAEEAKKHEFAAEWKDAEIRELQGLKQQKVCEIVSYNSALSKSMPLKWVYTYKFSKHGILSGFKARLCVRGDLQPVSDRETHATTLATRSFRVMIAVAARFSLEMIQYDAVSAFTNGEIDEDVWTRFPPGHEIKGS